VGQVTDLYISADIESDGPIPGEFSMLSFGLAVAGSFDGASFSPEPDRATFYRELQPISERFDPDALRVSGLDRNRLATEGAPPAALVPDAPHTHNALDDAVEQGEIFARLFAWSGG
jgi:hypothetical protein